MDYTEHLKLVEQVVERDIIGNIDKKTSITTPAIVIKTENKVKKRTIELIRNSLRVNDGSHHLYIDMEGKMGKIGSIDLNIDNIFILKNLLNRFEVKFTEVTDSEKREIKYTDFIDTIKL